MRTSTIHNCRSLKNELKSDISATILETAGGGEVPKSKIYCKSFST
jgi:hypothetical protein